MSGPQVYWGLPPSDLFTFPPSNQPAALPPPIKERTFRAPFGISPWLFNLAMRPEVPAAFALSYIIAVFALNAWNRKRGHKPWWIARQPFFKPFVILHNVSLAIYSFATFVAMYRALRHTWPGFDNPNGLAGVADSLCKIHGPRGLGDAATYNTTINIWESKNAFVHMSPNGTPDHTDVGRLWNEGLAFWGWIFYLSKFYEVLDTFIIVAKGKRSATLQTYHHAGAMLCMWAGMRYMSPPIWMFVFINSFIHALMYTYFTLAAVNVKVPKSIKRGLTTLQIAQFVFGASFAAIHLFVQYDIPIATPYKVLATVSSAAASATSAVASATSTVSEVIETPTAAAAFFNWPTAFKWILRAAGEEGLAERVAIHKSSIHDHMPLAQQSQQIEERMEQATQHALPVGPKYETRWRNQYTKVNCIDTSGEAFAIYLNLFYLFPLTVLFARFFYKAYVKRGTRPQGVSQTAKAIGQDARQAEGETERAIEAAGKRVEDKLRNSGAKGQQKVRDAAKDFHEDLQKVKEGGKFEGRKVSQLIENAEQKFQRTADSIGDATSPASTPKKSPKKKNNNNKKNNQGGSDDSRPSTSQENKKQDGGNDSRPSTSQENKQDSRPSTSQENKKGADSRPSSSQKNNAADVHDELKTNVDLKPEGQDAKSNGESSEASKPSEKDGQQESQAPSTPERKQPKNAGSKKESEVDESQGGLFSPLRNEEKPDEKSDEKPAAETEKVPAQDESAAKQDANLEASEPTRPAPEDEEEEPESASSSPSASTFIDYAEAVKSGELPEEEKKDDEEDEESTETASK